MANITNYETKMVECEECGWVGTVAKHIPLKQSWCRGCGSSRIRLYKERLTMRAVDLATTCARCGCVAKYPLCANCGAAIPPSR